MKARYYPWAIAGGVCVMAVPGSELWMVPAGLAALHMAYDTAPDAFHAAALRLLDAGARLQLPVLPALRLAGAGQGDGTALAPVARQRPAQPAQGPAAALRPREWVAALNDQPDRAPHALITGPTGAGKTTAARALLGQRGDTTVVLSPKISPDNWSGAEVITLDDEGTYAPLALALVDLEQEKRQRIKVLRTEGAAALRPLTVVLDEVPELVRFAPDAGDFITSMAGIGRELRVRLVLLSTSTRVAALGIKGRGDTLENFVRLDIDRDRQATLNDGIMVRPIELGNIRQGAERARLAPWRGRAPEPATATTQLVRRAEAPGVAAARVAPPPIDWDLLNSLLTTPAPVSIASGRQDTPAAVSVSVSNAQDTDTDTDTPSGGVSTASQRLDTPGGVTIHVTASASAPSSTASARRRPGQRHGLSAAQRRARADQQRQQQRRVELAHAYAEKKAAGLSFRKAYAELGGSSDDARTAWRAAAQAKRETA